MEEEKMAGSNIDRFWNHVVKMNDGSLNCEFCGHPFAKDTSISWIIWHLSGEKDRGVVICGQVPKQVQEAAFLDMHGGNSRHKTIASSSNVFDDAISTSPREQNSEVDNLTGEPPDMYEDEHIKPVGQAVDDNRNVIWSWLMDDEISTIDIYGMEGIGKTTMLQHIHDELLRRPDISHHVYWVTVPQDFDIYRLQNLIARHLDLDLSSEYDILPRAAKLSKELMKKQEYWILILDDLRESSELSAVGIPVPLKGCKVIFTTRSDAVCQRMGSQVITKVTPLLEREAWTLFMETLGHGIALSPEVERIAADIAKECAGLLLGIIIMAGRLRGVDDQDEWRNTLEKLKELKSWDMEDEVCRMLRFSYDRLDDKLQQCLLYCTLFPEDYIIKREELIDYLIDQEIIQKMWSREAAFDKGHAMLDRLENADHLNMMFLQRIDGGRAVEMHDLDRDMAVHMRKENPSVMGQRRKMIASGWTLLMTSLILEIASAVFDQLGYAFVGMVFAFVALLLATAGLIHLARKERMSLLPICHRTSTATFVPGKPGGTIVEYFGLVGAVWQLSPLLCQKHKQVTV